MARLMLTPVELECRNALEAVQEMFDLPHHQTTVRNLMTVLGKVRDALRKLKNKEYGCAAGIHRGTPCPCEPK